MNNPQEIANTFNDYDSTVADAVLGNIKKDKNYPRDNVNPSSYLMNKFNSTFPRISFNSATAYEIDKIIKSLKNKYSMVITKFKKKNPNIKCPFYHLPFRP